jgi:hypothetical protein
MRLRIATPSYGWNAFAWDVGIVALGVALAIGAERLVQRYNSNQDARHASDAIKAELSGHRLAAIERLAVQPCLKGQLKALHDKLLVHRDGIWKGMPMLIDQQADAGAQQRILPYAYRSPEPPWVDEAWQIARATGALNHLPSDDVSRYARVYRLSNRYLAVQDDENAAAARFNVLALDGLVDAQSRIELLGALTQADRANAYLELGARQQLELLHPLLSDLPQAKVERAIADRMAVQRRLRGPCVQPVNIRHGTL